MVFCNRCGEKTETVVTYPKLDLRLCKDCGDSFHSWLTMTVHLLEDKPEPEPIPNKIDTQFNLQKAQNVLQDAGYIFYKKPEVWGQKPKGTRKRRTKKEIELARENEGEGNKK